MGTESRYPNGTSVTRTLAAAAIAGLALSGGVASAVPSINFGIVQPTAGNVFYVGGTTPLVGLGIEVDFVSGVDTPTNAGAFSCIECVLNFFTGDFIVAGANSWIFAGDFGNSVIGITGGVDTDGDLDADIGGSGVILLLGSFTGPQVSVDLVPGPLGFGISTGTFLDIKNADLAAFFGLPMQPYSGTLTLGWGGLADPPGAFSVIPTNGVVRNAFVPEPGSTLLLGAACLMLLVRRVRLD